MDYTPIAEHFCKEIVTSDYFLGNGRCNYMPLLFPELRDKVNEIVDSISNLFPFETYRSNVRQAFVYHQGFSKIRQNGMHFYGVACDVVFKDGGGWTWDGNYKAVVNKRDNVGLYGCGKWDLAHVQLIPVWRQRYLRNAVTSKIIHYQRLSGTYADGIPGPKTQKAFRTYFNKLIKQ